MAMSAIQPLPLATVSIERPTTQVPVLHDETSSGVPGITIEPVAHCSLCLPRQHASQHGAIGESWAARPPKSREEEETWVSILETQVHLSCLNQAQAEKLLMMIPTVVRQRDEDAREFATRCLEPPHARPPLTCIVDPTLLPKTEPSFIQQYAQTEVPLMANHPFARGFKLFPQLAPPRTLEDLATCTSRLNRGGRLSESSLPVDIKTVLPGLHAELIRSLPEFTVPGGACDVLWRDRRNLTRGNCLRLSVLSPGSVLRVQRSRYRSACMLLTNNPASCSVEWAGMNADDAQKILQASEKLRSTEDWCWIPDLAFCLRRGARVYAGTQSKFGQTIITTPGTLYWGFVRGSCSTSIVQWSFAERSKEAFEYALQQAAAGGKTTTGTDDDREVDLLDTREDFLHLRLFNEILADEKERLQLIPKDLADALCSKLVESSAPSPLRDQLSALGVETMPDSFITAIDNEDVKDERDSGTSEKHLIPVEEDRKMRCDVCRGELFDRKVYCPPCREEGHDPKSLIVLQASHPPRPSSKKDRSTLPDWLRVGCRVLVNLTVSGNSNDRPPRVVGAAHLPGIILKTGHGFFTVYLEGCGETVVKRKAAIEPHPLGPDLAQGFQVNIKPDGGGQEQRLQNALFKECIYCPGCFIKIHSESKVKDENQQQQRRVHLSSPSSVVFVDRRSGREMIDKLSKWKTGIVNRSGVRKDDLCPWGVDSTEGFATSSTALGGGEIDAVIRPTLSVSHEAGSDAMLAAQIMGPSPYHYPTGSSGSSLLSGGGGGLAGGIGASSAIGQPGAAIASSTRHQAAAAAAAAQAAAQAAAGSGGSLLGSGVGTGDQGMMRTSGRSHRSNSTMGFLSSSVSTTTTNKRRGVSMSEAHHHHAGDSNNLLGTSLSRSRDESSSRHQTKRSRSGSSGATMSQEHHHQMYAEDDEEFPNALGDREVTTARELSSALQTGSFFVNGHQSVTVLPPVQHLDAHDEDKPEAVRSIWLKARQEVPLKKMWKFFTATTATGSSAQESLGNKSKASADTGVVVPSQQSSGNTSEDPPLVLAAGDT